MDSTELPVLIGVTGHRDLRDPEKVSGQLECFFRRIGDAMPETRFCLVSGLAAGADRLFIECGKRVLGDRVETFAVLPFAREEYQKDFSESELPAFRRLLDPADRVVVGDKIVTSNISDKYLPGILIGYISKVELDANNLTKSGEMVPAASFDHLSEVLVILNMKQELSEEQLPDTGK